MASYYEQKGIGQHGLYAILGFGLNLKLVLYVSRQYLTESFGFFRPQQRKVAEH